ncbi:hypothetical protein NDU88_006751 [Pleurodeles waltl]|uniref:Uncharacterized protein n=1 Tax=Pleurodeles waltl TaxID=8319 RepID=A0AAV7WFD6_PLEWA|nr:hypothetical protein NDU88_006751 [Pleurodeles waltl]
MPRGVLPVTPGLNWKRFPGNRGSPRHQGSQGFLKPGKSEREGRRPPQPTQGPPNQRKMDEPTAMWEDEDPRWRRRSDWAIRRQQHAEAGHALGRAWHHQAQIKDLK